jgi:SAM-dependent methyltransferase
MASDPTSCDAKTVGNNPRYIDTEIEMQYDGPNNPRTRGMLVRRFTGDSTPYQFPVTPVRLVTVWPPEKPPFTPRDFEREDETEDSSFYAIPRFVYHIDEPAVAALTQYYRKSILPNSEILDICSSWVSHYPLEFPKIMKRISATGMNPLELKFNDQLTDYEAKNLNEDVTLPYPDNSFDVVTCVVSIDYLNKPIEVLREVHRVLRPGGKVIISQSNRCFPTKAIRMWLSMNDRQHLELINGYFQYAGGFKERATYDITAKVPSGYNDPMFIIEAVKV